MTNLEKIRSLLEEDMEFFESLKPYADKVDVIEFISNNKEQFPVLCEYITGKTKKTIAEDMNLTAYKCNARFNKELMMFPLLMGKALKYSKQDLMK